MLRWPLLALLLFAVSCGGVEPLTERGSDITQSRMMAISTPKQSRLHHPPGATRPVGPVVASLVLVGR